MKNSLATLFLLLILTSTGFAIGHTEDPLSKVQENILDEKAVLVDVREKREWERGHVKGAILLPFSSLRDGITEEEVEPLPKEKIIYLHCAVGARAKFAGKLLKEKGFQVRPLKPGYTDLISNGFPKAEE